MITKKLNVYFCEFCKKSGRSATHISRHERHCTLNPNRICRVCGIIGEQQPRLSELISILPNARNYSHETPLERQYYDDKLTADVNAVIPELRRITHDCPACIMAALRQAHIPVPMATDFNFTDRMKEIWEGVNSEKAESYY